MLISSVLLFIAMSPCLGSKLPFIIGGTEVRDATKWPWQGSLRYNGRHSCGCSLIGDRWAVTAAHCVGYPLSYYTLRFGSTDRLEGGHLAQPNLIIMHEDYGEGAGHPNDIAVMRFAKVSLSDTIKPIPLTSTEQAGNADCWITGWGRTATGDGSSTLPQYLRQANVNVYTRQFCDDHWSSINDGHVCIGDEINNRGSCGGDSGGPLVCKIGNGYELVGVTSWGVQGCHTDYPSVYTRVSYFRNWVLEKTGISQ